MFSKLLEKFDALTSREKWLTVLTVFALLMASWYQFFYMDIVQEQTEYKRRLAEIDTQLIVLQQKAVTLQNRTAIDSNTPRRKQLQELQEQYQSLREQMYAPDKKFVHPSVMAKALSDLLKQHEQLTLIKLETQPTKPIELLYQHGLELRFSGNYSATLAYLKAVEAMPWNFFWDSIDYQVKNYPTAEITLRVHTLSLEKSWLDV
jgi:MSHA biogenesis protein MshJ